MVHQGYQTRRWLGGYLNYFVSGCYHTMYEANKGKPAPRRPRNMALIEIAELAITL